MRGAFYSMIERIGKGDNKEELLLELYNMVDEYNEHVRYMDKQFDLLISRLEASKDD